MHAHSTPPPMYAHSTHPVHAPHARLGGMMRLHPNTTKTRSHEPCGETHICTTAQHSTSQHATLVHAARDAPCSRSLLAAATAIISAALIPRAIAAALTIRGHDAPKWQLPTLAALLPHSCRTLAALLPHSPHSQLPTQPPALAAPLPCPHTRTRGQGLLPNSKADI
eukprot:scaffold62993_cov52-Phaeocystis_antarctica.AAC.2